MSYIYVFYKSSINQGGGGGEIYKIVFAETVVYFIV